MGEFESIQMFKFLISVMQTVDGVNEQRMRDKRLMTLLGLSHNSYRKKTFRTSTIRNFCVKGTFKVRGIGFLYLIKYCFLSH